MTLVKRARKWGMIWLPAIVVCVLAAFRVAEYVAIWYSDNAGAAFRQAGADLVGLFWLVLILAIVTATLLAAGKLAVKLWHLPGGTPHPPGLSPTGRLSSR